MVEQEGGGQWWRDLKKKKFSAAGVLLVQRQGCREEAGTLV